MAHIQSAFSTRNVTAGQSSFSVTVNALGAGNIVTGGAVLLRDTGTGQPTVSITDNASVPNTYTQLDAPNSGSTRYLFSFALKIPNGGGTTITCTVSGVTVVNTQIFLDEWSGYASVGNHAGANSSTVNPATTSSLTSITPNALFWGGYFNSAGFDDVTPGSGFAGLIDANDAGWDPRTEFLTQAAPGSTAVTAINPSGRFVTIVGIVLETPMIPPLLRRRYIPRIVPFVVR